MLTASLVLFLYLSLAVIEHDIPTLRQWVNVERQATLLQIKSSAITAFLYFIHIVLPHGKNACTFVTTTWCHLEFVLGAAVLLRDGVCQWEGSVVESHEDVFEIATKTTILTRGGGGRLQPVLMGTSPQNIFQNSGRGPPGVGCVCSCLGLGEHPARVEGGGGV